MATIASLLQILEQQSRYEFLVEQLFSPTYDHSKSHVIYALTGSDSPLYGPIYDYLKHNILPIDQSRNQKCNFIRQASRYTLTVDTLYRQGLDGTLLRCLGRNDSDSALHELHEGICGTHSSGTTLAKKLLWMGYYWPTMEKDSYHFAKKCPKC